MQVREEITPCTRLSFSYALSDKGGFRADNQDAFCFEKNPKTETIIALVADGVGSFHDSAAASKMLCESVRCYARNLTPDKKISEIKKDLLSILISVHKELTELSEKENVNLGTTATLLVIRKSRYFCIQVGDSRLYVLRKGRITQITEDQTLAESMRKKNASVIPEKAEHTLLQCIGYGDVMPKVYEGSLDGCVTFLVCSDGLYNTFSVKEMKEILTEEKSAKKMLKAFLSRARENGETDNFTGIIVGVER